MRCEFCRHGSEDRKPPTSHNAACPLASGKLDESKKIAFNAGWNHGRAGKEPLNPKDLTYMLGWLKGEAALEEAENGCDRAID